MTKGLRLTTEIFVSLCREKYGDRFDYSKTVYTRLVDTVTIGCKTHGDIVVQARQMIYSKTTEGCPKCAKIKSTQLSSKTKVSNTAANFELRSRKIHGGKYDYSKVVYVANDSKVTIGCKFHRDFLQTPSEHWSGSGCKLCAVARTKEALTKPYSQFIAATKAVHSDKYTYEESTYIGSRVPMNVVCGIHGVFPVTPDNHINRQSGCPKCSSPVSKIETELASWFPEARRSDRTILDGKELDLVFDEAKLAVEVNGVYWHSEAMGKGERYHADKTAQAGTEGYSLLQIYDTEIYDTPDIVRSMIGSRLGTNNKVHARKCRVIELDDATAREFCLHNHIQGYSASSVRLGLVQGDNLLSVMTFAKPRFDITCEYEMIRFCTRLRTTVVGGGSKLFSYFVEKLNPSSVLSYANLRYSTGGMYRKLGFSLDRVSDPSYAYLKSNHKVSRYKAQKHLLPKLLGDKFDPAKSESANMLAAGYNKVYDCGNAVFIWRK